MLFQSRLPMRLRVAPHPASSGFAGDRASSCLASRPSALPKLKFRLPRSSCFGHASRCVPPGRPGFCIFRPCRRWIFELPRISHPLAHPALKPGVSPVALHFRLCLPMHFPGCPGSCIFRLCRRRFFRLPRIASFDASGAAASGFPSASLFQLRLSVKLRVAPHFSPSGFALGLSLRVAPNSLCPQRQLMVPRVASDPAPSGFAALASSGCPESCIYGWVNDDFPVILELCILG